MFGCNWKAFIAQKLGLWTPRQIEEAETALAELESDLGARYLARKEYIEVQLNNKSLPVLRTARRKSVFEVVRHHHVLEEWARAKLQVGSPLHLITLDRHADTMPAFGDAWGKATQGNGPPLNEWSAPWIKKLSTCTNVQDIIQQLDHDEHIDAARKANIIEDEVFLLQSATEDRRPQWVTAVCFNVSTYDDALTTLGDARIQEFINIIQDKTRNNIEDMKYILDIDHDFFWSTASLFPGSKSVFNRLINGAHCITIAHECATGYYRRMNYVISQKEIADGLTNLLNG